MDRESIGFFINLNLVKCIVGGKTKDYGEVRFVEEGITVVYRRDNYG